MHDAVVAEPVAEVLVDREAPLRAVLVDERQHPRRVRQLAAAAGAEQRADDRHDRDDVGRPERTRQPAQLDHAGWQRKQAELHLRERRVHAGRQLAEQVHDVLPVLAVHDRQAVDHRLELLVGVAVEPDDLGVGEPRGVVAEQLEGLGATERVERHDDRQAILGGRIARAVRGGGVGEPVDVRDSPVGVAHDLDVGARVVDARRVRHRPERAILEIGRR